MKIGDVVIHKEKVATVIGSCTDLEGCHYLVLDSDTDVVAVLESLPTQIDNVPGYIVKALKELSQKMAANSVAISYLTTLNGLIRLVERELQKPVPLSQQGL